MSTSRKDVEQLARGLSAEDRAALAEFLLESLEGPISEVEDAWAHEIESRVAAYDRGELESHAAEDVFAEARRLSR